MKLLLVFLFLAVGDVGATSSKLALLPQGRTEQSKQDQEQAKLSDPFLRKNKEERLKNPAGLKFDLRLKDNRTQFQMGEIILLELSFSSTSSEKFILDKSSYDRSGRLQKDEFILDPEDGTEDPLDAYFNSGLFGFMGGGLHSTHELSANPQIITAELNEWIRFDRPGHYRLYVASQRVERKREPDEPRNDRTRDVVSNIVEFDIVPVDEKWASRVLRDATLFLENPDGPPRSACRTLRFLGTESAATELVKRFRDDNQNCESEYRFGLIGSPHRDLIIRTMERALVSAEHPVTYGFVRTLALLAFTTQAEKIPPYPERDNEQIKQWQAQLDQRWQAYEQVVLGYLRQLITAVPHKQEKARAVSLQTLLDYQTNFKTSDSVQLKNLFADIPAVFTRLPFAEQERLLKFQWKPIASTAMVSVLRDVYQQVDDQKNKDAHQLLELRSIALRRLYELSPEEGRELILAEIRHRRPTVNLMVLRSLPDETLSELDEVLAANLEESRQPNGRGDTEAISDLIERYATGGIVARVRAAYEAPGLGRFACRIQNSLLAYLLRVDPTTGGDLLHKALAARGEQVTRCYTTSLTEVAQLHMTAEVEEAARVALEENDPEMVSQGATVLGRYGSVNAEAKLWRRLERWHEERLSQASKLKNQNPGVPAAGSSVLSGEALIEQSLRNAISHGQAWLTDPEKLKRLRELCLTDTGRREVDEMISGWNQRVDIALSSFEDQSYSITVAHYRLNSLESLKQKLSQFPAGTNFTWVKSNSDFNEARSQELLRQISEYLASLGMKLAP